MKKIVLLIVCFILSCSVLTACKEKVTLDIDDYLKYTLSLDKYTYEEVKENTWDVTLKEDPNIVFHVVQTTNDSLFGVYHDLVDDYEEVLEDYNSKDFSFAHLEKIVESEYGLVKTKFIGSYADRAQLEALFDESSRLLEHLQSAEFPCRMYVEYTMNHALSSCEESFIDDGNYHSNRMMEDTSQIRKEATKLCILQSMDLYLTDYLKDFSKEEIEEAITSSSSCIGVCQGDKDRDAYVYYDDLCGSIYGQMISYPTLYDFLQKENYPVTGNKTKYSFVGVDGSHYEISYDAKDKDAIYCLKDGKPYDKKEFAHFYPNEIEQMTGYSLLVADKDYQPNENVYTSDGHLRRIDTFYYEDEELSYDTVQNAFFHVNTEDYRYITYNEDTKEYMIPMDIGWFSDTGSYPAIFEEWTSILGGTFERKEDKDTYTMTCSLPKTKLETKTNFKNNEIHKFIIYKDGKNMHISYNEEDYENASYCVSISLEDFISIFDLTYTIDEDEGAIYFKQK